MTKKLLLIYVLIFSFLFQSTAYAQGVDDFIIRSFDADYRLTNEDPQGSLEIVEKLDLTYSGENQGILRQIPSAYKGNDLDLKVISIKRDGNNEKFDIESSNGYETLRIGTRGQFITGDHSYELHYKVNNVISFYDNHDELYWDVNGTGWGQLFESVSATLKSDAPSYENLQPQCFTGSATSSSSGCTINRLANIQIVFKSTAELQPRETLTILQAYQKGYFTPQSFTDKYLKGILIGVAVILFQLVVLLYAYRRWKKYGRDYKKRGVVAPFYSRPKNMSVMQAAYVWKRKLEPQSISATIIDLAIRGIIKISESKNGKKIAHSLTLVKQPDESVTADEQTLLEGLFPEMKLGETVDLSTMSSKLHDVSKELQKQLDAASIEKGYFEMSPMKASRKFTLAFLLGIGVSIIGVAATEATLGVTLVTSFITLGLILIMGATMDKRSVLGNELAEHMQGLELYIKKAEKDRIDMQDAVAAPLSSNSGKPERTVTFFEELLPFAVASGVEKSWADAFGDIYEKPPEWYDGTSSSIPAAVLASNLGSMTSSANSAFSPTGSSSGSGYSGGGGFAGGGGGGGGGGGW